MTKGQKFGIVILAILLAIGLAIDVWYAYIYFFGNDKIISKTFKVGALTLSDGTTKNIFEVEYFANKDNSGYEAFEIKFTNYMDETKNDVFIQGLQYLSSTQTSSIDIDYSHNCLNKVQTDDSYNLFTGWNYHYDCQSSYSPTVTTDYYNYMSADDEIYLRSTNPITMNTRFKIEIGSDIYSMEFKGLTTPMDESTYVETTKNNNAYNDYFHHQYYVYDVNYFVKLLYESVKTLDAGTNDDMVFEWGNLFNYYKYNESEGGYDENPTDYTNVKLVSGDIKSYYSILVKTHENGLSRSSDSMFGSILGNGSFSLNNDYTSDTYFVGRTVINCDLLDFDLVVVDDNSELIYVALKLSEEFKNYYLSYKDLIILNIVIDLDELTNQGCAFVGFSDNHGLDNFIISNCQTISNGEVVDDFTTLFNEVNV